MPIVPLPQCDDITHPATVSTVYPKNTLIQYIKISRLKILKLIKQENVSYVFFKSR